MEIESHWYPKVSLLLLLIGFLFILIGYGSPHWAETNNTTQRREHFGLWKYCTYPIGGDQHCDDFINLSSYGDWLKVVQAFMTMALFIYIISIGITFMVAFVEELAENNKVYATAIITVIVAVVFMIIAMSTFAAKCDEYFNNKEEPGMWYNVAIYDWAYYLTIVSCILAGVACFLLILKRLQPDGISFGCNQEPQHTEQKLPVFP